MTANSSSPRNGNRGRRDGAATASHRAASGTSRPSSRSGSARSSSSRALSSPRAPSARSSSSRSGSRPASSRSSARRSAMPSTEIIMGSATGRVRMVQDHKGSIYQERPHRKPVKERTSERTEGRPVREGKAPTRSAKAPVGRRETSNHGLPPKRSGTKPSAVKHPGRKSEVRTERGRSNARPQNPRAPKAMPVKSREEEAAILQRFKTLMSQGSEPTGVVTQSTPLYNPYDVDEMGIQMHARGANRPKAEVKVTVRRKRLSAEQIAQAQDAVAAAPIQEPTPEEAASLEAQDSAAPTPENTVSTPESSLEALQRAAALIYPEGETVPATKPAKGKAKKAAVVVEDDTDSVAAAVAAAEDDTDSVAAAVAAAALKATKAKSAASKKKKLAASAPAPEAQTSVAAQPKRVTKDAAAVPAGAVVAAAAIAPAGVAPAGAAVAPAVVAAAVSAGAQVATETLATPTEPEVTAAPKTKRRSTKAATQATETVEPTTAESVAAPTEPEAAPKTKPLRVQLPQRSLKLLPLRLSVARLRVPLPMSLSTLSW